MTLAAIESVTYADGHEQIERFAHSWAAVSAAKHAMGRRTEKDPSVSASSCYVCSKPVWQGSCNLLLLFLLLFSSSAVVKFSIDGRTHVQESQRFA